MENDWDKAAKSLAKITVTSQPNNEPVTISGNTDKLKCKGVGTDAAVFQSLYAPSYVFKKYAQDKLSKVKAEAYVYEIIGGSSFFPNYFASYDDFLVLSHEEGKTLFDCILQGIHIPEQVIKDVEDAREYVRNQHLNPRDIHLKNILLQHDRAKILDVSEYSLSGNDFRWEHLKKGYEAYYHVIDGKPVPFWLVETVRKWYNYRNKYFTSFDEFMKFVSKLMHK